MILFSLLNLFPSHDPIRPPALFIVDDVIGSYKDYKNEKSLIMKIVSPKNNLLTGYIVAAGIPDKGI